MGGEREDVIQTKKSQSIDVQGRNQSIRIHEQGGEVHFHVDEEKLKCAVPVNIWWKAWGQLKTPNNTDIQVFTYTDYNNKTVLYVATSYTIPDDDTREGWILLTDLHIHRLTGTNPTHDQLQKFTEAK